VTTSPLKFFIGSILFDKRNETMHMFATICLVLSASIAFAQNDTATDEPLDMSSTIAMTEFFTSTGFALSMDLSSTVMDTSTTFTAVECSTYNWFRRVVFQVSFLVDPTDSVQKELIRQSCAKAFYDAISAAGYGEEFCFDLPLAGLEFHSVSRRRQLLQTVYYVSADFEYDDALESGFFESELYYNPGFESNFGDSLKVSLVESGVIEDDGTALTVTVSVARELEKEEVRGDPIVSAVTILSLVDIIVFLFVAVHFVRDTLPRATESKEAAYKTKSSLVFVFEFVAFLIYFAFAIRLMATLESYLGYILLCLWLTGVIVFGMRVIVSSRVMTQIEKLRATITDPTALNVAIIDRRTDFGVLGAILSAYIDGPVLIIAIVAGHDMGYTALEVLAMLFSITAVLVKVATLFYARFAKDTSNAQQPMQQEIELAEDKQQTNKTAGDDVEAQRAAPDTAAAGDTKKNDVQEEEQPDAGDAQKAETGDAQKAAEEAPKTDDAPKDDDAPQDDAPKDDAPKGDDAPKEEEDAQKKFLD